MAVTNFRATDFRKGKKGAEGRPEVPAEETKTEEKPAAKKAPAKKAPVKTEGTPTE